MAESQQKYKISLPSDFDDVDRTEAAQLSISRIVERTNNGLDVKGKKFVGYSESYVNSLDFKIAGKSKDNVNLQLSGDTLNSIQVLNSGPGFVEIGFKEGTPENDKAAWAQEHETAPIRKFLGLNEKELDLIVAEVRTNRPRSLSGLAQTEEGRQLSQAANDRFIQNLLRNLQIDTDEE